MIFTRVVTKLGGHEQGSIIITRMIEPGESRIRAKAKLGEPSQQEGAKKANSPQFKHRRWWLDRFKKIATSVNPTFARLYGYYSGMVIKVGKL